MGLGKLNPGSVARESPCAECDICECQMNFSGCALSWNCVGSTRGRLYKDNTIISDSRRGTIYGPSTGIYVLEKLCNNNWIEAKRIIVPFGPCNVSYPVSCCQSIRDGSIGVGSGFDESSSGTISGLGGVFAWANGTYAGSLHGSYSHPCFGSGGISYAGAGFLTALVAQYPGHGTSVIQVYRFGAGWTSAPHHSFVPPYLYENQISGNAGVSVIVRYANGSVVFLGTPTVIWGGPIQCSLSGMVYKPVGPVEIKAGLYSPVDIVLMPATIATVSVSA